MRTKLVILLVTCLFVLGGYIAFEGVRAQTKPTGRGEGLRVMNTQEQIESLLRDFLNGAGTNDVVMHDRFWAEDLLYTGSSGALRTKTEIMKNVREAASKPPDPKEPKVAYSAEDVIVHDYGDFAVVNFKLVARSDEQGKQETRYFRNTGTFRKQNSQWKVVGWQATRIEEPKPEEKK